ncbi:hydantoinase/oxoprolinase family protein (plasmid) [Thalassobaculum sp. OXR-137]|uniref:hydantoinase/oxoprolinase family protein n=1 Tax=Thalassobaculum sp. OXR-137 TaxID=3100173 RepID=UPI002AC89D08|nr:hydantoinase/oxoprolinase family protein [Thalassobaculum sp. OXR-137]WPZ37181.1 hydantoinase/oxoprolinase family protein [Thalassobaculum sp. OXR-137]
MRHRVGVDIGGSFTDFAIVDEETLEVRALKVFSRPDRPGAEVIDGINAAGKRYGISGADISYFTHGTTVGVNTVIQRKGIKLALFTTENFCDVLELGRLKLPSMFDLLSQRPQPLVSRDMVFGVRGRLRADGSEFTALNPASVEAAVRAAEAAGAEGIVISFLHSFRSDRHEMAAKRIVERMVADIPVFTSAEIWPIVREFERTTTAVIGSYVQPRVAHYFTSLQAALKEAGVTAEARVAKSNGGVMSVEQGKTESVQTILSGTASGVIGAAFVAQLCGLQECMSLDVGGTSADVALIVDGQPQYGIGEYIGDHQIHIPSVSVTSIGEGGGSIAWVDTLGVLKVGPESAGSTPGPACFGRGGERATITDAFAVCGIVGQSSDFGYSAVKVDVEAARKAVGVIADQLSMGIEEAAEAIIKVAVSGMFVKVTGLVTRFGIDPRSTAMLPFGGAGPMMGCLLAREMEMPETVIPTVPGVLSALGGLIADLKNDFIKTVYLDLDAEAVPEIRETFAALRQGGETWLRDDQGYDGEVRIVYSADMRYRGQSFEVEGIFDPAALEAGDVAALAEAFHGEHEKLYGHANRDETVQIVNLRLVVAGRQPAPHLPLIEKGEGVPVPDRMVQCWIDGGWTDVGLFRRAALLADQEFDGPAIVVQDDTTVFMPSDTRASVDAYGHLRITQTRGH